MKLFRVLEEVQRNQWAMTTPALRAMLALLDGEELSPDDYRFFHAVAEEQKTELVEQFGPRVRDTLYTSIDRNVGYLLIDGPIIPRATWFSQVSGMVSLDVLASEFKNLEANPRVDTIVLLLDSPGGAVQGVSDFAELIRQSEKKTVGYTWMAASAAYWIASAADEIVSPDTGLVGSIGTVLTITDYSKADEKRGIKTIEIVSSQSPNKRANPATDEGRAVLQTLVDDLASVFISTVAKNRKVTDDDVLRKFGGGAMFVARRALDARMIDRVKNSESLIKELRGVSRVPFGFNSSADNEGADVTSEGNMSDPKEVTAEDLKKEHASVVDAIVAEAVAPAREEARAEERARIEEIEKISEKFESALPSVKEAAVKVINSHKFNPEMSREAVLSEVLEVVSKAQSGAVHDFGASREEAAKTAEHASAATGDTNETAEEREARNVKLLVDARDKAEKGRK